MATARSELRTSRCCSTRGAERSMPGDRRSCVNNVVRRCRPGCDDGSDRRGFSRATVLRHSPTPASRLPEQPVPQSPLRGRLTGTRGGWKAQTSHSRRAGRKAQTRHSRPDGSVRARFSMASKPPHLRDAAPAHIITGTSGSTRSAAGRPGCCSCCGRCTSRTASRRGSGPSSCRPIGRSSRPAGPGARGGRP